MGLLLDYTLNNPDTLTKYKTAAQISHNVLEAVGGMFVAQSLLTLLHDLTFPYSSLL